MWTCCAWFVWLVLFLFFISVVFRLCKILGSYLFNSMAIHVMLMITIPKFWCSIGPGVNECAAGEQFLSLLFGSVRVFFFLSFFLLFIISFRFIIRCFFSSSSSTFYNSRAIHLNQCNFKEIDTQKRCVDADFCFMFLFAEIDGSKRNS